MYSKQDRLNELLLVLQYCTQKHDAKFFTLGERICINQERGQLLTSDFPEDEINDTDATYYGKKLADKISKTLESIQAMNWIPTTFNLEV